MILNSTHLNQRLSVDDQNKEIERIKEAPVGAILFSIPTYFDTDVIDTLLHKSGVHYRIGVAGYTANFYKVPWLHN